MHDVRILSFSSKHRGLYDQSRGRRKIAWYHAELERLSGERQDTAQELERLLDVERRQLEDARRSARELEDLLVEERQATRRVKSDIDLLAGQDMQELKDLLRSDRSMEEGEVDEEDAPATSARSCSCSCSCSRARSSIPSRFIKTQTQPSIYYMPHTDEYVANQKRR